MEREAWSREQGAGSTELKRTQRTEVRDPKNDWYTFFADRGHASCRPLLGGQANLAYSART